MINAWEIIASNAILATFLGIGTALVGRVWKNPAALHLLWVIVLLKLFTPPAVISGLPFAGSWFSGAVREDSAALSPSGQSAMVNPAASTDRDFPSQDGSDVISAGHGAATSMSSVASITDRWSVSAVLVFLWALGASCVALGYTILIRRFARSLQRVGAPPPAISKLVARVAGRMGMQHVPQVLMTPLRLPPLIWSIGGPPRMILPAELFARLSENAQAAIIAHELAHIRRRDHLVRLLELAATIVFWWHPIVWIACWQLRDLEEQCCDQSALELAPRQERAYAATLVDTVEFLSEEPRCLAPLSTAIHSTDSLVRRIKMLAQPKIYRLDVRSGLCVAALAALPLVMAFTAGVQAEEESADADSKSTSVAVLSGRVTNEAGEPVPEARVIVAIPARDMRFVDSKHKTLEAQTDEKGEYRLEVPTIKPTSVSFDVLKPEYRRSVGTLMSGGDAREVAIAPGAKADASFVLQPALYLKGTVVDEQGKPISGVEIAAGAVYENKSGGVERTISNPDGSFELFNYAKEPRVREAPARGLLRFEHPDYIVNRIQDIYAIPAAERESLRIVLPTGHKVSGTVHDIAGNPVSNVMVEAFLKSGRERKATMTGANGEFSLRGLAGGPSMLRAHALEINQKIKLPIDLDGDKSGVDLRLEAISLAAAPKVIDVLGMQLTDNSTELQSVYEPHHNRGALILDPGEDSDRLEIGELVEGDNFWMVGMKRVESVREFVEQILAEAAEQDTNEYSVRVVYSFRNLDYIGTNTQYLKLTKEDIDQLREVQTQLTEQ